MSEAMSAKGYVVRGTGDGHPVAACGYGSRQRPLIGRHTEYATLDEAAGARARMLDADCTDVRIFAVAEDGTEMPIPTYEEALARATQAESDLAAVWSTIPSEHHGYTKPHLAIAAMLGEHDGMRNSLEQTQALLSKATSDVLRMSDAIERLRSDNEAQRMRAVEAEAAAFEVATKLDAMGADLQGAHGEIAALRTERDALSAAWARYAAAVIDDRDAIFAEEQEQNGAEEWRARTKAAVEAAKADLVALGVDVDALLKGAIEGR